MAEADHNLAVRSTRTGPSSTPKLESQLRTIWTELFLAAPESDSEDFFLSGGNSLLAMRFVAKVRERLGQELAVSAFAREPTIAGAARQIREGLRENSVLYPLCEGALHPPLFAAGSSREYRDLSRALGADQPFYQMDSYALFERCLLQGKPLPGSVPEIAERFVRDIQLIQPKGPYFLAGHCDGAVIAFETAVQLQASGETVAFLGIFDTPPQGDFTKLPLWRRALRLFRSGPLGATIRDRMSRTISQASPCGVDQKRHEEVTAGIWDAIAGYRPTGLFDGEIQLFRAETTYGVFEDVAVGWNDRCTLGIRIHDVPGDHVYLFQRDETQGRIAAILREARKRAEAAKKLVVRGWVVSTLMAAELAGHLGPVPIV
jgi:surfactin synthase thioesterase subunit